MFFGALSIFRPLRAIQPLVRVATVLESDCTLCGATGEGEVCAACGGSLDRIDEALRESRLRHVDDVVCAFAYRFPLDALVRKFKYGGDLAIGRWLAGQLADRVAGEPRPDLTVVPPSSRSRLRQRGFNPALEIATVVGRRCAVRAERGAVVRRREDEPQAGLPRSRRVRNLRGAFGCAGTMEGLGGVIVDDVITTGATAEAIARVLKAEGAARVRLWAVARTPLPGS